MGDCGEGIAVPVYWQNCRWGDCGWHILRGLHGRDLVPNTPGGLLLGGPHPGLRQGTLTVANVSRETFFPFLVCSRFVPRLFCDKASSSCNYNQWLYKPRVFEHFAGFLNCRLYCGPGLT